MRVAWLLPLLLLLPPGCATVLTTYGAGRYDDGTLFLSGTRLDTTVLSHPPREVPWLAFALLDLPFSLAVDLALAPLTLVQSVPVWRAAEERLRSPVAPPTPPPTPSPPADDEEPSWRTPRTHSCDAPREYRLPRTSRGARRCAEPPVTPPPAPPQGRVP